MKRIGNLYTQLLDKEHIKKIIYLASRGKTKRREVRKVLKRIDYYAEQIVYMLKTKTYYFKKPHHKTIIEKGKERVLSISPFYPNIILDYIVVETLKPKIRKGMYEFCIGNVDKRGIMYGKRYVEKKINKYKYFIKLDIKKFYPSVKSINLSKCLRSYVKDKDFLELADKLVLNVPDLPIGSYYSQWFSNLYLQKLDHYIKEELKGVGFYIRYVDDMVLMGNNKRKLLNAMYNIDRYLKTNLELKLKRYEIVKSLDKYPVDFIGFKFYKKRPTKLRTRIFKMINKRVKRVRKKKNCSSKQAESLMSYLGWLKHIPSGINYYRNHIKPIISFKRLRNIIRLKNKKNSKSA